MIKNESAKDGSAPDFEHSEPFERRDYINQRVRDARTSFSDANPFWLKLEYPGMAWNQLPERAKERRGWSLFLERIGDLTQKLEPKSFEQYKNLLSALETVVHREIREIEVRYQNKQFASREEQRNHTVLVGEYTNRMYQGLKYMRECEPVFAREAKPSGLRPMAETPVVRRSFHDVLNP